MDRELNPLFDFFATELKRARTATSKTVIVRDTQDRDGAMLRFGADAWCAFVRKLHSR